MLSFYIYELSLVYENWNLSRVTTLDKKQKNWHIFHERLKLAQEVKR